MNCRPQSSLGDWGFFLTKVIHIATQEILLVLLCFCSLAYSQGSKEVTELPSDTRSEDLPSRPARLADERQSVIDSAEPVVLQTDEMGQAQSTQVPDTVLRDGVEREPYVLDEIVITATKWAVEWTHVPSSVTVVSQQAIAEKPGSSLGASLEGVSGLLIRAYGGGAALQTASVRGMSSEHTLLLVDGQRLTSFQNGLSDFGILSTTNVERIEVVKGGYSSLYGADAIGGAINVITKLPSKDFSAAISAEFGSSGFQAHEVLLSGTEVDIGWRGVLRRERGTGDYEYEFDNGRTKTKHRRSGADFTSLTAETRLDYRIREDAKTSLSLSYSSVERGTPGPVTEEITLERARLDDEIVRSQFVLDWTLSRFVSAKFNSSFIYSHETYHDPQLLINGFPLRSFYINRVFFVTPEVRITTSHAFSAVGGVEIARGWITSNEVRDANRWQHSFFLSTEHTFLLPFEMPYEILLYPSLRYDHFSDVKGDLSPRIGINVGLLSDSKLRLRTSYGKSFRVPTFNDLYWRSGGNPLLRPERSLSFDMGAVSVLEFFGKLTVDASYFHINTNDRIVWTPGQGGIWSPKNITDVRSRGFEVGGKWNSMGDLVRLSLNSTFADVKKRSEDYPGDPTNDKVLIYLPKQTVNASASITVEPFALFVQHSWVSYRFTTEINDRILPHYSVTSATFRFTHSFGSLKTTLKIEGTNLFNTSYQIIALYPMPLREFRISVGAEL